MALSESSGHALPTRAIQDGPNGSPTHAETRRELIRGQLFSSVQGADFLNLPCRQFGAIVSLAGWRVRSPLAIHVVVVVGFGSDKQVCRIAADSVVAAMACAQPFGEWPIRQHPSNATGVLLATLVMEPAISVSAGFPLPRPAVVGAATRDLSPEPVSRRLCPSPVVSGEVVARPPLSVSEVASGLWSEGRFVPAPAFAVAERNVGVFHDELYAPQRGGGA